MAVLRPSGGSTAHGVVHFTEEAGTTAVVHLMACLASFPLLLECAKMSLVAALSLRGCVLH